MKTPTVSSATSSRRGQTSLRSPTPRLPRSSVCSTQDLASPSASVHPKRFSTPSLTRKVLCAGNLNPRFISQRLCHIFSEVSVTEHAENVMECGARLFQQRDKDVAQNVLHAHA